MNRRGFLGSILALGAAPAIVRADSLMKMLPMETIIIPRAPILSAMTGLPMGFVREIWMHDIVRDEMIHRFDVRGLNRDGLWTQSGVDVRYLPGTESDPAPALEFLRQHIEDHGTKLEPWTNTQLPDGVGGRFL
jgi:hypothetical protein